LASLKKLGKHQIIALLSSSTWVFGANDQFLWRSLSFEHSNNLDKTNSFTSGASLPHSRTERPYRSPKPGKFGGGCSCFVLLLASSSGSQVAAYSKCMSAAWVALSFEIYRSGMLSLFSLELSS
jgi:hypothetical protein